MGKSSLGSTFHPLAKTDDRCVFLSLYSDWGQIKSFLRIWPLIGLSHVNLSCLLGIYTACGILKPNVKN